MTTELSRREDDMPLAQLGETFARAKWFGLDPAQAVVKVLAGRELGLGAFASVTGIHLVQGRPELSANAQAVLLKKSGRYDYRVRELTEKVCAIEFFALDGGKRESLGVSTFTMQDAEKAKLNGKEVWRAFPRNMLFARALTNGVGWFCPDAFGGLRVYAEGEIGGEERAPEVDEEPRAVRAEVVQGPRPRGPRRVPQDAAPSLALPGPTVDAPASPPRVESQEAREIARPAPKAAAEDDVELRKKLRGRLYSLVAQKFGQLADDGSSVKAREACGVESVATATNAQLQDGIAVLSALPDWVEPKVATASQPAANRAPAEPYTVAAGIARGLSPETAEKLAAALGDDKVSLAELVKVRSRQELSAAKAAVGIPAGSAAKDAAEGRRVVMALSVLAPKAAADVPPASPPTRAEVLARKLGGSPEAVKLGAELAAAEAGRTSGSAAWDFSARAGDLLACRLQPAAFEDLMAAHPGLMEEDPVTLRTVLAFVDAAPDAAGAPLGVSS